MTKLADMLRLIAPLLGALVLWSSAARGASAADWTGTWDTRWQDGGARMQLTQEGDRVRGTYPSYNGGIEGRVQGTVLRGRWTRGPHSGLAEFVMAPDGRSFVGRYNDGDWWTGGRVEASDAATAVDQSSPREAMRAFLDAGNAARHDAPDLYARAAALVDFGPDDAATPPERKVDAARALFALVDQTTFRLFALPDASLKDERFALDLRQAGTGATLPLAFLRRDGRWFLAAPDARTLDEARKALLARSDGRPPLPDDYLRRRSARDAMRTFERAFFAWDEGGREQARSALDLSNLPEAVRDYTGDLASLHLNAILNRVGLVAAQEIPDDPRSTEPYVVFSHPQGRIVVAPVTANGATSWRFNAETVARARNLYAAAEDLPPLVGRRLPEPPSLFLDLRRRVRGLAPALLSDAGGLEVWQILGWIAVLLVAAALGLALTRILHGLLGRALTGADEPRFQRGLRWSLWGTLTFSLYKLMIPAIGLPDFAKRVSVGVTGTLLVLSAMGLGWALLDALAKRFFGARGGRPTFDNILVSLALGALKLVLLAAGLTAIAIELSLPYEGVIASLSIGGLAVAFASRETLSNVFGAGVLALDRPFRRGDQISAGGTTGTVEQVGIRSTRVRTADDSLLIMPNGKLADATVSNLDRRRYHLHEATLPLAYATRVEQVEALLAGARDLVAAIPHAAPDRTVVSVAGLSRAGIELSVKYGLDARRGGDETAVANGLALDLLRLCERLGVTVVAAA